MRQAEEVQTEIDTTEKDLVALKKHLDELRWELRCAKLLPQCVGWVGWYMYLSGRNNPHYSLVFPATPNRVPMGLGDYYAVKDGALEITASSGISLYSEYVKLGEVKKIDAHYVGFFATEEETRQFIEKKQAEAATKEKV